MLPRSRTLWLILLLLGAVAAPRAVDLVAPADGWEQSDDARFEAVPVPRVVTSAPLPAAPRVPEQLFVLPVRLAEAEIFRPPIG